MTVVHQGHSENGDAALWWAVMSVSEGWKEIRWQSTRNKRKHQAGTNGQVDFDTRTTADTSRESLPFEAHSFTCRVKQSPIATKLRPARHAHLRPIDTADRRSSMTTRTRPTRNLSARNCIRPVQMQHIHSPFVAASTAIVLEIISLPYVCLDLSRACQSGSLASGSRLSLPERGRVLKEQEDRLSSVFRSLLLF